jgi:lipopolysaccharide export LptBFGC system permease protein LptF
MPRKEIPRFICLFTYQNRLRLVLVVIYIRKKMNKKFAPIALMLAALFGTTVANAQSAPAAGAAKPTVIDAAVTDNVYQLYEGEVVKIDKKTRTITFKNKEGESKFVAGPDIKNFDQIKKGDRVNVNYELAVAIELIKTKSDGVRTKVETNTVTKSKANEKPSETITNQTTIIADIVEVNREKKLVSVKGPSGKITTVTVKNPALLADVKVGEQVKVIYFDAMAASITTPKK